MPIILFFTLLLNIVAIVLTYNSLSKIDKKERIIVVAVGIAVVYVLTSFVYWLSTKDIAIKEVSELGKNIITFLFVPINSIIVLPLMAKSYNKYKIGRLASDKLRNRGIVLGIILLIVLIIECSYFKDIQNGVIRLIEENKTKVEQQKNETSNIQQDLEMSNEIANVEANQVINEVIVNTEANQVINEVIVNTEANQSINETFNSVDGENVTSDVIY